MQLSLHTALPLMEQLRFLQLPLHFADVDVHEDFTPRFPGFTG
jgi:hypothetical protein